MTTTFSQTARDVVTGAMHDLGVLPLGDAPEAQELAYGLRQLNLTLKSLAVEGWRPWTDQEGMVTIPANEQEATLDVRPVAVSEARINEGAGHERPLERWNAGEYDRLPNRRQTGVPLAYELRETVDSVALRVWPVPLVDTVVMFSYSRVIQDVDANAPLDVPQMWIEAVGSILKTKLTAFGAVDPALFQIAEMQKQKLLDYDRPESYQIGGYA